MKYLSDSSYLVYSYLKNTQNFLKDDFRFTFHLSSLRDAWNLDKFERSFENGLLGGINNLDFDIHSREMSEVFSLDQFDTLMKLSIKRRLYEDSMIVFFSEGIDSIIISLYLHLVSDISKPIYLLNTGFKNSYDRIN